jgi:hypothetical protein
MMMRRRRRRRRRRSRGMMMMMMMITPTTIPHSRYPAHKPRSDISEIKLNASYCCFDVHGRINYTDTPLYFVYSGRELYSKIGTSRSRMCGVTPRRL